MNGDTNTLLGVIGMGQSWVNNATASQAKVGRPSETIMVAEKHNDDVRKAGELDVPSWWGPGAILSGPNWWDAYACQEIPNATLAATNTYPNGPDGCVSTKHMKLANFLFCDGHVKAMHPYLTNPDPVKQPQNNMWDATRS
jgi:prepilin-type processing-associated H-X9-DG protein